VGQNWWWVVLVILVVVAVLAVAALRARGGRAATPPSDVEIAAAAAGGAAGAVGAAAVVATHSHGPPAGTADTAGPDGDVDPEPPDDEARTGTPSEAVHPPTPRVPQPADSALAALDSGLVGRESTFGAAAAAVSAAVTRPGPHPGSVLPAADGDAPSPDYPVKANEGSHRYHTPDSPYYVRTRGDVWFRTAQDAQAAGFTAWNARR
jgi:hypothetical protein